MPQIERDPKGNLIRPEFQSDVPPYLLKGLPPAEVWQLEQQSIAKQQNEWLITMAVQADDRQGVMEKKMMALETLRVVLSSKWSLIGSLTALLLVPIGLIWAAAWVETLFKK